MGKINSGVKIELKDKVIDDIEDDYFELELFENHYIFFEDVNPTESLDIKDDYYEYNNSVIIVAKIDFFIIFSPYL